MAQQDADRGLSLPTIAIVLGLAGAVLAITFPGFIDTRQAKYESAAVGGIRAFTHWLESYRAKCGIYPTDLRAASETAPTGPTCTVAAPDEARQVLAAAAVGETLYAYRWQYHASKADYQLELLPRQDWCKDCRFFYVDRSGAPHRAAGRRAGPTDPAEAWR